MTDSDDWDGPDPAPAGPGPLPIREFTSLRQALEDALADTPHLRRDRATIALAFRYADLIDDAADRLGEADEDDQAAAFARMAAVVAKIGPRLEATLGAMGMAPGARTGPRGGEPDGRPDAASAALEQLRAGRPGAAAGIDPAALVDPAVTAADTGD